MTGKSITIDAVDERTKSPHRYWILNEMIHNAANEGYKHIILKNVFGQRFIAACMEHGDLKIDIYGTPGNDLGVFMSGPTIEVHGNCEDQTGNTMNSGKIVVHGNAWDVTGLAARGGSVFVRGDGGYRIGIHMKAYKEQRPVIVYGGSVKEFFGEYMAGGVLVALGMKIDGSKVEDVPADEVIRGSLGSGIHGGTIYIRGKVPERLLGVSATAQPFTQEDDITLRPILEEFCRHFDVDMERIYEREIAKIGPSSSRPFSAYYNARPV